MLSKKLIKAAAGNAAEETDENFNQTVLLLHGDGTNGAQNNTFLDSSSNNFTITRNGNTTQGTFSPFSAPDGRWSNYFDGTGDYLSVPSLSFAPTGSFSADGWCYITSTGSYNIMLATGSQATAYAGLRIDAANADQGGNLTVFLSTTGSSWAYILTGGASISKNAWVYFCVTRDGSNNVRVYLNGTQVNTTTTVSGTLYSSGSQLIGAGASGAYNYVGYLSNVRLLDGTVLDGSVPTSPPSTSTTNQQLLTCYGNRFADFNTATTAKTITVNGNPKVTAFSPFAPTAAYSASVNGGSGYFGGTSLVYAPVTSELQMGTGEFTIEGWIYLNAVGSQYGVYSSISSGASNWTGCAIDITSDKVRGIIYTTSGALVGTVSHQTVLTAGQWYHFALVRASGVVKVYVDGVVSNTTLSTTTTLGQNGTAVGAYFVGTNNRPVNGYLADVRVVKGTAIDFASTGIPTAPLTNITNTKLLLNFTNAGIYDNTGKNVLETVANAQIDTTTKKFGTGAIEYDGSGDYLKILPKPDLILAGDFTIDCWFNFTGTSGAYESILDTRDASASTTGFFLGLDTALKPVFFTAGANRILAGSAISTSTWYFLRLTRASGDIKLFIDGTQVGSTYSNSNVFTNPKFNLGADQTGTSDFWTGFVDDFRITNGVARSGAEVPTKAFPDL